MHMLNEAELIIVAGGSGVDEGTDGNNEATEQVEKQQESLCYKPGASTTCSFSITIGRRGVEIGGSRTIDDRKKDDD